MPVMIGNPMAGRVMLGNPMRSGQSVSNFINFTSANTINAKKAINDVKNSVGSRHICVCGNSTKAGWGSIGSTFGTPASLVAASRRASSQIASWATALASIYSIPVSQNSFWGDAGLNTPFSNITTFDPRITGTGSPTFSGTVLGPGGHALTTTDATSIITFTPGVQFDRLTLFYAGTGAVFNVSGDVNTTAQPSTAGSGNAIQQTTFSFAALNNAINMIGTTATGMRVYGGYTWKSTDPATLYIHNMGWGNSTSANWSNTTVGTAPKDAINSLAPSLILFSEGINDPNTGVALNTHNTNIQAFINNVKKAAQDVIMYDDHWTASVDVDGAAGHATLAVIAATLAGNKASALSLGIPYVDSPTFFASYANQKNALNYMYDVSHMKDTGQAAQASNLLIPMTTAMLAA